VKGSSFEQVRSILRKIQDFISLSDEQVSNIIEAAMNNGKIIRCKDYYPRV
jgi:hypothetical protein